MLKYPNPESYRFSVQADEDYAGVANILVSTNSGRHTTVMFLPHTHIDLAIEELQRYKKRAMAYESYVRECEVISKEPDSFYTWFGKKYKE